MRIGSFFLVLAVVVFLALPVVGYQYYLKGLRGQAKGLGAGADQISSSYKENLDQLRKLKQDQNKGGVTVEDAAKRSEEMMRRISEAQNKK